VHNGKIYVKVHKNDVRVVVNANMQAFQAMTVLTCASTTPTARLSFTDAFFLLLISFCFVYTTER